jgi:hypothetical protein
LSQHLNSRPTLTLGSHLPLPAGPPPKVMVAQPLREPTLTLGPQYFVLTFTDIPPPETDLPSHRRIHSTYAAAEKEAQRILSGLADRAAHPAIIDGPACGPNGRRIY